MIVCIGAFDGYHRGHFSLFRQAREMAARSHTEWKVVTFSPHPRYVLGGLKARLFTREDTAFLRRNFGIPEPLEIPFTREFASTEPWQFLDELRTHLHVTGIVVGREFRFGRARSGDSEFLTRYCARHGLELALMPQMVTDDGVVICSTRVRDMVQAGNMEQAAELLGYPWFLFSQVVCGERRGRAMGYPTANMIPDEKKLTPGEGVYAGALWHGGCWWPAAVSVGRNPTFLVQGNLRIETHAIGFQGNLYGCRPLLVFLKQLRLMARFGGQTELAKQLAIDCERTQRIFGASRALLDVFVSLPECSAPV